VSDEALAFERFAAAYARPPAQALRDVDLHIRSGEMIALLGASGAGKSTLLKCANRIVPTLKPADLHGRLRILGEPAERLHVRDLADRVGFVFQDFEAQLFSTSVEEEILFGLEQVGVDAAAMRARVDGALAAVDLVGFERRDPSTLSGGEKQRLAIAAVYALDPRLWLLDEPATDLDPAGRRELFALMARLRTGGATLVLAEHDVEALIGADRWVVLDRGRVAFDATPLSLLERADSIAALGVRPPDLAIVCARLGIPVWPLDVESVAERIRARGGRRGSTVTTVAAASAGRPVVLQLEGVRFRYEDQRHEALRGVDLTVREGEFVALIGANGSGKSTLAKLAGGLLRGGSGTITWRGQSIESLDTRRRAAAVGYVFQNPDEQIFAASVGEEIAFGPRQLGCSSEEISSRVGEVVAATGLMGLESRDPFLLAKGERQKVAVASILALRPALLILDEPTTGLDHREQLALMDILDGLHRYGQTVIIITHVPWVVGRYAQRAVLLQDGAVLYDGPVDRLFADEALCRRGDFVPPDVARLGNRLGVRAVDVEGLLAAVG
jgi:energy-coupling factor transport system ATP-binding protein